jgi:NCS1 family nucleobase:cation symporter-1
VTGVPYPVVCRASFGVLGANIPAIIRGLIAVAWYGVQTYLASAAFMVLALHMFPSLAPYAEVTQHGFAGLSTLGWVAFMVMWVLQAFVFWHGMEAIRKFIDWAGPAVYVVMAVLCGWLVWKAGWSKIDLNLGGIKFQGWDALPVMLSAIALVVSYFSGPMLNFGDFSRYGKSFDAVKKGNFWGLPVNFVFFSLLTVITTAATVPVFGELITDPVHIGPLFGILIADYYIVRKQRIDVDALYTMSPKGEYWYSGGYNPKAIMALVPAALVPILCVMVPTLRGAANYAWFIGMGLGFVLYALLNRNNKL